MAYEFIPSPHFSRRTKPITAIVLHYTGSLNLDGTLAWFQRPESKVSAHYVIGRDGRVVQMVRDNMVAWHAGKSTMPKTGETNVNYFSLGIELVGTADSGFTDRQLASLYALLERLVVEYKVRPERVVGHKHIAPGRKIDPDGYDEQFPWRKAFEVCAVAYRTIAGTGE